MKVFRCVLLFTVTEARCTRGTIFFLLTQVHADTLQSGIKLKQRLDRHIVGLNRVCQYANLSMKIQFLLQLLFIFIAK